MTTGSAGNAEKVIDGREGSAPSVPADTETFKARIGRDDLKDELLPGIPNDIACQVIAPKLSVTDINTLSMVSPSWYEAVHRRWVYDARVRSYSTDTFVVSVMFPVKEAGKEETYKLRLYPLNGNFAYDLPPIPSPQEICNGCNVIALDGKIYILGGVIPGSKLCLECCSRSKNLFMLDLVGHKQWKQCASMQEGRQYSSAGVLDGKIYVIGGCNNSQSVYKCEVYDPKVDTWSSIADLIPLRSRRDDRVAAIGGELFLFGGAEEGATMLFTPPLRDVVAYNPVKNEWRQIGHFNGHHFDNPWYYSFVAQGKFHTMIPTGIDVYDMDTNSWSNLHHYPSIYYNKFDTWALDDEILTPCSYDNNIDDTDGGHGWSLVRSRGLGRKNREISFEAMGNWRLRFDLKSLNSYQTCLVQL